MIKKHRVEIHKNQTSVLEMEIDFLHKTQSKINND